MLEKFFSPARQSPLCSSACLCAFQGSWSLGRYDDAADERADRAQQKELRTASTGPGATRGECAAWCISGRHGRIYTWGDGTTDPHTTAVSDRFELSPISQPKIVFVAAMMSQASGRSFAANMPIA